MKRILVTLILGALAIPLAAAKASPTPTPSATPIVLAGSGHAWMEGGKLLVSGSALGLLTEKDARQFAVKDAAAKAAEFLEGKGLAKSSEVRRGVEESILRETALVAQDFGDVKIEDICQERWSNENGVDVWSMHLTLSIRVGQDRKKKD
jgi:hypothetical protein